MSLCIASVSVSVSPAKSSPSAPHRAVLYCTAYQATVFTVTEYFIHHFCSLSPDSVPDLRTAKLAYSDSWDMIYMV